MRSHSPELFGLHSFLIYTLVTSSTFSLRKAFRSSHLKHSSTWQRLPSEDLVHGHRPLFHKAMTVSWAQYPYIPAFRLFSIGRTLVTTKTQDCCQGVNSCCLQTREGYAAGMLLMIDSSGNTKLPVEVRTDTIRIPSVILLPTSSTKDELLSSQFVFPCLPHCAYTLPSLLLMSLREVCSGKFGDIIHLDLVRGISYSIFPHDCFTVNEVAHTFSVKICSDFVAFLLRYNSEDKIYLAKLSTQSCRIIKMEVSF
jgi:hypothetical protein